jgi:hypothetical protein
VKQSIKAMGVGILIAIVTGCSQPTAAHPAATATPAPSSAVQAAGTSSPATAPTTNPAQRINGTIQSVSDGKVTLTDGKSYTVDDKTRIIRIESAKPSDLATGDYVAVTAKRQPDNTLLASIVNVFPASMKGVGVGQRPMGGGNLMTNATVDQINGDTFTVTFPGGGARVKLAPKAQINKLLDGSKADLKAGLTASALVDQGVARSVILR